MSYKIAFINSVYGSGSTGKIVEQLYNYEKLLGNDAIVIYSRNNTVNNNEIYKVYDSFGFYNHVANALLWDKHGLYSKKNTIHFIDILDRFKPDIINIHNLHGFYVNYPMLMSYIYQHNIPVVLTMHDCWIYTGFCSHYDANQCYGWKTGCRCCKYKCVYPYRLLKSNSKNNYELKRSIFTNSLVTYVTPSKWLLNEAKQSFLFGNRILQISNSIDTTIFKKNANVIRKENQILAIASIWTKQKGLNDLQYLSNHLDSKFKLVVVGKGSNKVKNAISYERLEKHELVRLYQESTCFINLTYEDTYPTVNLEALSCGCPIITYRTGGSSELCNSKLNVVNKGDIKSVIKLINIKQFQQSVNYIDNSNMEVGYHNLFNEILEINK